MDIHVAAFTNRPIARGGGQLHGLRHLRKHRRPRSGHAPLQTLVLQPLNALPHFGAQRLRHGLKIVVSESQNFLEISHPSLLGVFSRVVCSKALDCSSFCVPFEFGRAEDALGGRSAGWLDHHKPRLGQLQRRQLLSHTFDPGVPPADEKGHISTQLESDGRRVVIATDPGPRGG